MIINYQINQHEQKRVLIANNVFGVSNIHEMKWNGKTANSEMGGGERKTVKITRFLFKLCTYRIAYRIDK